MLTYQEALAEAGSRHRLRKMLETGELHKHSRNLYCRKSDRPSALAAIFKRYPRSIATGMTALYLHGLVDMPPDLVDIATKRGGTKISDPAIRQHFIPDEWLDVGSSHVMHDGESMPAYDRERMLLELMRSRNKIPYDIYREAVRSYRKAADSLDIYKLEDYARLIPRGESYLERALEEVL